jgi:hypothetical protein
MSTNISKPKPTALTLSSWTFATETPRMRVSYDTRSIDSNCAVLLPARQSPTSSGNTVLVFQIDPAALERKLFIRQANAAINGKTIRSNTIAKVHVEK